MQIKFFSGENLIELEEVINAWLAANLNTLPGIQITGWQLSPQGDRQVLSILYHGNDIFKSHGLGKKTGN